MKKNLLIYLTFIGLIGLLTGCEKDGTIVKILSNPVAPTLTTVPDMTLSRVNATKVLEFAGTPVDPGFAASATYYLEACLSGTDFADPVIIYSGTQCKSIKMTQSELNGILLKKFPADAVTSADFRIRSVLVVDAGTGAPGTSTDPFEYSSSAKNANVTLYGLPRLDLINSGRTQKIESAMGDGKYFGYVKLDAAKAFTLLDPDSNTSYGNTGGALAVNGAGIVVEGSGWHKLSADVNAMTFKAEAYMIGLIGSATPNGWSAPDQKMDYDAQTGLWYITLDLVAGAVKIRANDTWGSVNLGLGDATHPQYNLGNLWNDGGSKDIPITEAGNYTIKVFIGSSTYWATITKNN